MAPMNAPAMPSRSEYVNLLSDAPYSFHANFWLNCAAPRPSITTSWLFVEAIRQSTGVFANAAIMMLVESV